jgi:hypothetical protein
MGAAPDAIAVAEQLSRERERRPPFPDSGRAVEEVGVRVPLGEGRPEQSLGLLLLGNGVA